MKTRIAAVAAALLVLALVGVMDSFVRRAQLADVRAAVSVEADSLARNISDVVARETSAVDAMAAFVAIEGADSEHMSAEFPAFAKALANQREAIRSIQLAPDSILRYVYPVEGNEAAIGLDLMADPDRRALLGPVTATGGRVVQGPVELVQGGVGLIVRSPVYSPQGSFWGFSAVVLDWPSLIALTEMESKHDLVVAGLRIPGSSETIAGDSAAFVGDPISIQIRVGATDTAWQLAARPADGWPSAAPLTPVLWLAGILVAVLAAWFVVVVGRRPELLRAERQRALEELATAEARYQTTFEHAGVGILLANAGGRVVSANPSMCRISGCERKEDLIGALVEDLVHPDSRLEFLNEVGRLGSGVSVVEQEIRIDSTKGETWCQARVSTIPSESTDEPLYIGIAEDVTVRRVAEKALAQSELRFRQLFEMAPIAIQREDYSAAVERLDEIRAQGVNDLRSHLAELPERLTDLLASVKIIDANPAANRLQEHLATTSDDVTLLDRFSEETADTFVDTLAAIWDGQSSSEVLVSSHSAAGARQHLSVRWYAPEVDDHPDYSNVMVTISDVTELTETGRQLQELLESKDRFVASVAHELRTPLTAVVGFAQELNSDSISYTADELKEFQELVAFHSTELSHIIEDLLVWARNDIGEVRVNPIRFDLGTAVRQSLLLVPGMKVPVAEPDGPLEAIADPARVRQIVRNLATNAVRYGGSDVQVSVSRGDGQMIIEVSDDGPAIPPDRANRIFEPYGRSEQTVSQPGSIGLGLTVSRALALLHGGDLVFFRRGERNVFQLTLPHVLANQEVLIS